MTRRGRNRARSEKAAQIDSVVTGIVAEYEESGTNIDRIEVSSSMTDKDLLWIIAINSAAYRQDLNAMSADLVRELCKASLSYSPSLGLTEDGGDGVVTTLTVKVKHLDPDELMDELGFDEDAKQWAGALYETLEQSDAINKYRTYYETYRPDHSGDGSFSGDVEYGTDYDNQIDISRFVDPGTKNNLDLAAYAVQAWENNWGYAYSPACRGGRSAHRKNARSSYRRPRPAHLHRKRPSTIHQGSSKYFPHPLQGNP